MAQSEKCDDQDVIHFLVPPMVAIIDQPLPVVVGTTIILVCETSGVDPPNTISWTFNGTEVSNDRNFSLTLSDTNYGDYTCTASNEFGSGNSSVETIMAGMLYVSALLPVKFRNIHNPKLHLKCIMGSQLELSV